MGRRCYHRFALAAVVPAALLSAILFSMLLLLATFFSGPRTVSAASPDQVLSPGLGQQILYTVAAQYHPLAWLRGAERFPAGAQIYVDDGRQARLLVTGFYAAADPSLSFDTPDETPSDSPRTAPVAISSDAFGVLFAGKQNAVDPWQVWEVRLAGGSPRQLTTGADDHIRPLYLPASPTGARIVYARRRSGHYILEDAGPRAGNRDAGAEVTPLSFVPGDYLPAAVLQDGRVLFSASYPLGSGNAPEIYTVYPDGSGVESYRCDHSIGRGRFAAVQISSGDIVFTHGPALARFTSPLAHEVTIAAPPGDYAGDIAETAQHEWLIASRANAGQPFRLHWWHPGQALLRPAASLIAGKGINIVQPLMVTHRIAPRRFPSALHEWSYANLLALNAYTSRDPIPAKAIQPIQTVRAFTLNDAGKPLLLGTAPVQKDGSFFVQVPGDRPLRFELLNASGQIIRAERGWMWARGGEQRICVGCHAGPEHAPENAVPAVLNVSATPADLTGAPSYKGGH